MRTILLNVFRVAVVSLGLSAAFAVTSPAIAAPHLTVQSQVEHFLECLGWMITDPAKHAEQCGPASEYVDPWTKDKCGSFYVTAYIPTDYVSSCCEEASYTLPPSAPGLLFVGSCCYPGSYKAPEAFAPRLLSVACISFSPLDPSELNLPLRSI